MTTLILGHERRYPIETIRCSPIDPKLWYYKPYVCVDFASDKSPEGADILYDLFKSIDYSHLKEVHGSDKRGKQVYNVYNKKENQNVYFTDKDGKKYAFHWNWEFAKNDSYDEIIDCMGNMWWDKTNPNEYKYRHENELLYTIHRVLKVGGKFYSPFGIYTKINDSDLQFQKKKRCGYQYVN